MKLVTNQKLAKAIASARLLLKKSAPALAMMVCFAAINPLLAQNIAVKGRVLDAAGQGISNASVTVKGSATGVSSDQAGNFIKC